jgi:CheY-like chemotaxis protein
MEVAMARRTVLVIEANEADRARHGSMLRFVGFEAREASSLEKGLKLARELRPDLIFLELSQASPSGPPWRVLQADPATQGVPLVALADLPLSHAELEAAGFCGQLSKPVQQFRIVEEAERCLGSQDEDLHDVEQLTRHGLVPSEGRLADHPA